MQTASNFQELPANSDFAGLSHFFESTDTEKYLEAKERQFWLSAGCNETEVNAKMSMLEHNIDKARTQWACITAKSQRQQKSRFQTGAFYEVKTFQNYTTVQYMRERERPMQPPDRTAEPVSEFSEKSRRRMLTKAKKLNREGLPIPYFITLTYHKNYKDCKRSKKHLNTFFQRWRRRSDEVQYFWKMEFQTRGAIHYHIALFIPESLPIESRVSKHEIDDLTRKMKKNGKYQNHSRRSVALMILTGADWAEVTREIDGVDVPFTRFDYIRSRDSKPEKYRVKGNTRTVNTKCANPRVEYKIEPDFEHKAYGTNVRVCDSWRQFIGYVGEYMKKRVSKKQIPDEVTQTGRFWGYSYNLDFEALQTGIVDFDDLEKMNDFCNILNSETFGSITGYLIESAERAKRLYSGRKLEAKLQKYRNTFKAQKRRFIINRDKIENGYSMQFEINAEISQKYRRHLPEQTVKEAFP